VYITIPPITKGSLDKVLRREAENMKEHGIDGLLIGNLGHADMFKDSGLPLMGDYSLNIYNSQSVMEAKNLGLEGVTLSHELSLPMIKSIKGFGLDLELAVYGRIPIFISEHCPIESANFSQKTHSPCGLCQKRDYYMRDRKGASFPILGDPISCKTTLLNKDIFNRLEYVKELASSNCANFRLYFYEENPYEIRKVIDEFHSIL
jgi:putative protease